MTRKILAGFILALLLVAMAAPARAFNIDLGLAHDDINNDGWFQKDKYYHWGVSAFLVLSSYSIYHFAVKTNDTESLILCTTWSFTVGLAKEDFDKNVKKTFFSFKDLGADGAGVATGLLIIGACRRLF
jgi:hypothetical protein